MRNGKHSARRKKELGGRTAVLIKTSPNRPSLHWTVRSVKENLATRSFRIYISDEAPLDPGREDLYDKLIDEGHYVHVSRWPLNVGEARNHLLECLEDESQVLRLDDDFELGGEFSLDAMENVLWSGDDVAFCSDAERQVGNGKGVRSGAIRPMGGGLEIRKGTVYKTFDGPVGRWRRVGNIRYRRANFTRNLVLLKRHVIENIRWTEKLVFEGEHLDLMLTIQDAGLIGAYTADSIHLHRDDLSAFRGADSGGRGTESYDVMREHFKLRWGCSKFKTRYPMLWYPYEALRRLVP